MPWIQGDVHSLSSSTGHTFTEGIANLNLFPIESATDQDNSTDIWLIKEDSFEELKDFFINAMAVNEDRGLLFHFYIKDLYLANH